MKYTDNEIHIKPLGDSALVVELADYVSEVAHEKVMSFIQTIENDAFIGFVEAVPTYNNVTVFYDPVKVYNAYGAEPTVFNIVANIMKKYTKKVSTSRKETSRLIEIPVLYGGEFGPDLDIVANLNQMTREEVIQFHSKSDYLVYMIGFAPGFPFLGGMNKNIGAPRKDTPRAEIPAGSVGIAGKQTGIYPFESPGGWQIIGRTPVELFLPKESPPTLIKAGDLIRFVPIDYDTYTERKGGIGQWESK